MPAEKVLFVCIGNAGRSQMAQAFAERAGFEARSAGSHAESELHPEVVEVMREVGIDLGGRVPHQLADEDVEWADLVVTMGCGDACPVLPGKRYLDWNRHPYWTRLDASVRSGETPGLKIFRNAVEAAERAGTGVVSTPRAERVAAAR